VSVAGEEVVGVVLIQMRGRRKHDGEAGRVWVWRFLAGDDAEMVRVRVR
jgi:hypothetical protein